MVHATRIRGGQAAYCNHWVRTHKLAEERRAGFPIYAKFGDQEGVRGVFVALLELLKQKVCVCVCVSDVPKAFFPLNHAALRGGGRLGV